MEKITKEEYKEKVKSIRENIFSLCEEHEKWMNKYIETHALYQIGDILKIQGKDIDETVCILHIRTRDRIYLHASHLTIDNLFIDYQKIEYDMIRLVNGGLSSFHFKNFLEEDKEIDIEKIGFMENVQLKYNNYQKEIVEYQRRFARY